jgi:IS5 family transposase
LNQPVPHPTTLVKLVGRAGPQVLEQLNAALVAKLAGDKLLRGRKLRIDTTVVAADIDDPTDADLLDHAIRKHPQASASLVGWSAGSKGAARPPGSGSGTAAGPPGGGCTSSARCCADPGSRWRRSTSSPPSSLGSPGWPFRDAQHVAGAVHRLLGRRPGDGRLRRLAADLDATVQGTGRLLAQTAGAAGRPAHHRRPHGLPGRP